jgi:antitoxin CptB
MSTLKKLIYKSHYRGTKEGDFLLSSFSKCALEKCSESEQKIYARLLECTDVQIHEWVLHPPSAPLEFQGIVLKIADFHKL